VCSTDPLLTSVNLRTFRALGTYEPHSAWTYVRADGRRYLRGDEPVLSPLGNEVLDLLPQFLDCIRGVGVDQR